MSLELFTYLLLKHTTSSLIRLTMESHSHLGHLLPVEDKSPRDVSASPDVQENHQEGSTLSSSPHHDDGSQPLSTSNSTSSHLQNHVTTVMLVGIPIVSLHMDGLERLCLAQISNTLLKEFSYNEIHNRRVALGITCIQCTPVQLEILRR